MFTSQFDFYFRLLPRVLDTQCSEELQHQVRNTSITPLTVGYLLAVHVQK